MMSEYLETAGEDCCVLMNLHPQFFILLLILMLVELAVACLLLVYEREVGHPLVNVEEDTPTGL